MTGRYQAEAVMRGKEWYGGGEVKLPFPPYTLLFLSRPCIRPPLLTSSSCNRGNLHAPSLSVPSRLCAEAMAYGMIIW